MNLWNGMEMIWKCGSSSSYEFILEMQSRKQIISDFQCHYVCPARSTKEPEQ